MMLAADIRDLMQALPHHRIICKTCIQTFRLSRRCRFIVHEHFYVYTFSKSTMPKWHTPESFLSTDLNHTQAKVTT